MAEGFLDSREFAFVGALEAAWRDVREECSGRSNVDVPPPEVQAMIRRRTVSDG
jgi:hypothetical protein